MNLVDKILELSSFQWILNMIGFLIGKIDLYNYKNMDSKIGKTFKLTKKLGSGAFGEIFHGINVLFWLK